MGPTENGTGPSAFGVRPGEEATRKIEMPSPPVNGTELSALDEALFRMMNQTPEQIAEAQARAMKAYPPLRTPLPGKTVYDMVRGQWPGDETDEQIRAALDELS